MEKSINKQQSPPQPKLLCYEILVASFNYYTGTGRRIKKFFIRKELYKQLCYLRDDYLHKNNFALGDVGIDFQGIPVEEGSMFQTTPLVTELEEVEMN